MHLNNIRGLIQYHHSRDIISIGKVIYQPEIVSKLTIRWSTDCLVPNAVLSSALQTISRIQIFPGEGNQIVRCSRIGKILSRTASVGLTSGKSQKAIGTRKYLRIVYSKEFKIKPDRECSTDLLIRQRNRRTRSRAGYKTCGGNGIRRRLIGNGMSTLPSSSWGKGCTRDTRTGIGSPGWGLTHGHRPIRNTHGIRQSGDLCLQGD